MSKLNKNQINEIMKKDGYELVSDEYIGSHKKIKVKCDKGHIYETNFHRFQDHQGKKGKRCPYCYGNKRHSFEYVKQYIENIGYSLLSKRYKNNRSTLIVICDNGIKHKMTFDSLKSGHRCVCNKGNNRSPQEDIIYNIVNNTVSTTVIRNDKRTIKNPETNYYFELDVWMPELRKAIEFNSSHWHKGREKNDEYKIKYCKENDIKLLVIWYNDWVKNEKICEERIKEFILNE